MAFDWLTVMEIPVEGDRAEANQDLTPMLYRLRACSNHASNHTDRPFVKDYQAIKKII